MGNFGNFEIALSNVKVFSSGLMKITFACGLTIAVDLIYSRTEGLASLYLPLIGRRKSY